MANDDKDTQLFWYAFWIVALMAAIFLTVDYICTEDQLLALAGGNY